VGKGQTVKQIGEDCGLVALTQGKGEERDGGCPRHQNNEGRKNGGGGRGKIQGLGDDWNNGNEGPVGKKMNSKADPTKGCNVKEKSALESPLVKHKTHEQIGAASDNRTIRGGASYSTRLDGREGNTRKPWNVGSQGFLFVLGATRRIKRRKRKSGKKKR